MRSCIKYADSPASHLLGLLGKILCMRTGHLSGPLWWTICLELTATDSCTQTKYMEASAYGARCNACNLQMSQRRALSCKQMQAEAFQRSPCPNNGTSSGPARGLQIGAQSLSFAWFWCSHTDVLGLLLNAVQCNLPQQIPEQLSTTYWQEHKGSESAKGHAKRRYMNIYHPTLGRRLSIPQY